MHRESIYVCRYTDQRGDHVAHVRAWDNREAVELFARELELDGDDVPRAEIRVRALRGPGSGDSAAA